MTSSKPVQPETKYCSDYPGAPGCCNSCHDDAIEFFPDYPLSEIEIDGRVVASVCCAVYEFAKKAEGIQ